MEIVGLLNLGSDSTLVSKGLVDKLKLSGNKNHLVLSNLVIMSNQIKSKLVQFSVLTLPHSHPFKIFNVWVAENLKSPKRKIDIENLKGSYHHLCDLYFSSVAGNGAAILIGADFTQYHLNEDIKIGKNHKPIAIQSTLGWVLLGGKYNIKTTPLSNSSQSFINPLLYQTTKNVWEIESYRTKYKKNS